MREQKRKKTKHMLAFTPTGVSCTCALRRANALKVACRQITGQCWLIAHCMPVPAGPVSTIWLQPFSHPERSLGLGAAG